MLPLLPLWGLKFYLKEIGQEKLQFVKKLRSKYSHISNGLIRTGDIVAELFQSEVLTARERDDIQQLLSTPIRANEQLLNTLVMKDSRAYECFLTALSNTDQKHITELLKHEDNNVETGQSLVIRRNYVRLIHNLDVNGGLLLDRLYEAGVLTDREIATINAKPTKHEKNETLLAFVEKFRGFSSDKFIQALKESGQEHAVSILTGKDCSTTESIDSSAIVQSTVQDKHFEKGTNLPIIPECLNRNLRHPDHEHQNTGNTFKGIKLLPFDVKRKSVKLLQTTFIKFPDELQTELSVKVASLRQITALPSDANVDVFYYKLAQDFIQQGKGIYRKHMEMEGVRQTLGKVKESADNSEYQLEDQLKAEISLQREELGWQRNNKRHIDETFKKTVTELDESRRRNDALARQLDQYEKEGNFVGLRKERGELQKQLDKTRKLMETSNKRHEALLMDRDSTLSELKEKLAQERKFWAEEKEQLMNQMQEQQSKFSAELRYKVDPVLVHTIRTKAAKEEKKWIFGLTILDRELFVVSEESSEVEVYDSIYFNFSHQWILKELINPKDIGSCNRNKCLYILDYKDFGQSKEMLKVDRNGNLMKKWSTGDDCEWGLSVTDESSVSLTLINKDKLSEYSSDGQLIREIKLSLDACIPNPWHAIKLTNGNFLVSHGYYIDDLHSVCLVDEDGILRKSYGWKRGSTIGQMDHPVYLAVDGNGFVMVADLMNSRVLLLDSDLKFKREILSNEKHGLLHPRRILLDETNNRLFVVDNELVSEKRTFIDGRILIFEFR